MTTLRLKLLVTLLASSIALLIVSTPTNLTELVVKSDLERVNDIYHKIIVATGRSTDAMPISIVNSSEINAYNNGSEIVIYSGIIKATNNDDELALVIAHEVAHGTLGHTTTFRDYPFTREDIEVLESEADKQGAFLMMRAGYNICKAREIWKRWTAKEGDYLASNHPGMAYRYDQLNVQCE